MEISRKYVLVTALALLLLATFVQAGIMDNMNTQLTDQEKQDLANTISPVGRLIGIMQYLAGAVIVLGIMSAGYTYYKGDPVSKKETLNKVGALIVGSILVFGAVTVAKLLGIGG